MRSLIIGLILISPAITAQERPHVPFIEDILAQSDTAYTTGMKCLVSEIAKDCATTPEQTAKLNEAAMAAVKTKMDLSRTDLWAVWDKLAIDGEMANQLAFWQTYRKIPNSSLTPERLPVWEEAVKATLNPEQFGKWEVLAKGKRDRIDKAVLAALDKARADWIAKRTEARTSLAAAIIAQHQLTPAEADALKLGVAEVINQSVASWGKGLETTLREYVKTAFLGQADARLAALENGGATMGNETDEVALKAEDAAWEALLQKTLTPTQLASYQAAAAQKTARRVEALGQVVVSEIDRKVLLTQDQRQKLQPLVTSAIQEQLAKMEALLAQSYVNTEMLLCILPKLDEANVKSMLQPDQWTAWREAAAKSAYFFDQ
jgi:hypothetical protein